jgi:hypothetical protein
MKIYGVVEYSSMHSHSFMPCNFNPRVMVSPTYWIGGWFPSRAGLDDVEERDKFWFAGYYYYSEMWKNTDINNSQ